MARIALRDRAWLSHLQVPSGELGVVLAAGNSAIRYPFTRSWTFHYSVFGDGVITNHMRNPTAMEACRIQQTSPSNMVVQKGRVIRPFESRFDSRTYPPQIVGRQLIDSGSLP